MKKKKHRKRRPQPPRWVWYMLDGCWFCENRTNCGRCKVMKEQVAFQKQKQKRKEKAELRKLY